MRRKMTPSAIDWKLARDQFPALAQKTFLDSACVSLAPRVAVEAVHKFLEATLHCPERSATLHHIAMDDMRSAARSEIARLISADEKEIALVESTSAGLNIAAAAIPLEPGDRVLLCDLEFMQVALPWCQMRNQIAIEIDVVPNRQGGIDPAEVASRITPHTRILVVSSVQWSNGFRVDMAAVSKICRDAGIRLVVDGTQQLGAIPFNVRETPVDFLACGGHKWLNAPFGQGFLYIRRDAGAVGAAPLRRPPTGYLSLKPPVGGWGNYFQTPSIAPVRDYQFTSDARVYEIGGTGNYPGAAGLTASIKLINDLGTANIEQRIRGLTDELIAGLLRIGVPIATPPAPRNRSGIITFDLGSAERNVSLMEHLLQQKVMVSVRYTSNVGGVRVSCHFFNSSEDVHRLLELTEHFVRGRRVPAGGSV
jgi:cysteine desulfurase / selenocysteine lyase